MFCPRPKYGWWESIPVRFSALWQSSGMLEHLISNNQVYIIFMQEWGSCSYRSDTHMTTLVIHGWQQFIPVLVLSSALSSEPVLTYISRLASCHHLWETLPDPPGCIRCYFSLLHQSSLNATSHCHLSHSPVSFYFLVSLIKV